MQPAVIARSDIRPSYRLLRQQKRRREDLDFGIILAQGEDGRRRGSSVPRLEQSLLGLDMKEEGDEG